MEVLFLGTSAGTPTKHRNVSGIAVIAQANRCWCLVDCGEATQHQLLHTHLSLRDLSAIFITHIHGDHCYGLPGILASAAIQGRTEPLTVVAPPEIRDWMRATQALTQSHFSFDLRFINCEQLPQLAFEGLEIETLALVHRVPSFGFVFTESVAESRLNVPALVAADLPRGPLWGELQQGRKVLYQDKEFSPQDYLLQPDRPRKVIVCGDNEQPHCLRHACEGCDLLVHEATFTSATVSKIGTSYGHSTAEAVGAFAQTMQIPNLALTHFSPRYQPDTRYSPSIADLRQEASLAYHGNLWLAEDFKRLSISRHGEVLAR